MTRAPLHLLFYAPNGNPAPWLDGFQKELPEATVRVWEEGDDAPADFAVVWKPPRSFFARRDRLRALFNLGAGVDAILQHGDALPQGVPIIRLDDAGMGEQMADYVAHAVLRYFRRFDTYDSQRAQQEWRFHKPRDKGEFTVGILGLGVLGSRVATTLMALGFTVAGWSRSPKQVAGVTCYAGPQQLPAFLQSCKVLACLLPLTDDTRAILDRKTLSMLPRGACLINVARGEHLAEDDLLALIRDGHIAGATLDVFQEEPLPAAHPFWQEPRITITPHVAAVTMRDESIRQIAGKIRRLVAGETVAGVVDRQKGY